jgi:hypothetical protein
MNDLILWLTSWLGIVGQDFLFGFFGVMGVAAGAWVLRQIGVWS